MTHPLLLLPFDFVFLFGRYHRQAVVVVVVGFI